jgi:hypothetical protein
MMISGGPVRLMIDAETSQYSPLQSRIMIEAQRIAVPSQSLDTL